jgi:hypothetical protein
LYDPPRTKRIHADAALLIKDEITRFNNPLNQVVRRDRQNYGLKGHTVGLIDYRSPYRNGDIPDGFDPIHFVY